MILTMNARRFQRTDPLSGLGSSQDICMGVPDLALTSGSVPVMDAVCTSEVGSTRIGRVLDGASDREDRPFRCMLRWRHTTVIL